MASRPRATLPVVVIGGYLGSGKTTLVNTALRNAAGRRLAIFVNEFGTLSIDTDLIEGRSEDVVTLAGGCICCTYGDDLVANLLKLSERSSEFDAAVIECSGVALPGQVANAVSLVPHTAVASVATILDASTISQKLQDRYVGDTVSRQIQDAHLLLLNKVDLAAPTALAAIEATIAGLAPKTPVIRTEQCAIALDDLLDSGWQRPHPPSSGAHDRSSFFSQSFTFDDPLDTSSIATTLTDPCHHLVRAKGILRDANGSWKILQIASGRVEIAPFRGQPRLQSHLVCISDSGPVQASMLIERISAHIVKKRRSE